MDKERLSRRGIRPVYENGWAVCFVSMYDGWKTGKCQFFFWIFCPSRTFTCWGYVQFFDICSVYLYPSINITRINSYLSGNIEPSYPSYHQILKQFRLIDMKSLAQMQILFGISNSSGHLEPSYQATRQNQSYINLDPQLLSIISQATQATTEFYFDFGLANPTHTCLIV